jgi:hypothetical protein
MTTGKAEFVKRDRQLEWLEPAFKSLAQVLNEYVSSEEEPPYYNNETASVSLLVAAGARSGYVVLADYRTDKTVGGDDRNGRCDFYIEKRNRYLEIEAKQIYGRSPGTKGLKSNLGKACKASKELKGRGKRAGLLFAVLSQSKDQASHFNPQEFKKTLASSNADLCWWWYDSAWRKYEDKANCRYYPGLAVLLKK